MIKKLVSAIVVLDDFVHVVLAIFLVLVAFGIILYSGRLLIDAFQELYKFSDVTVALLENILLIMIILELLWLIVSYLKARTITVEPFLFIGIISGVRKILIISAESLEAIEPSRFKLLAFETLISLTVTFVLIISLYLIRKSRKLYLGGKKE